MAYMRRTADTRENIRTRFQWAASLVCVAARYPARKGEQGVARNIARYAQGDDYHDVLDRPLDDLETFIRDASQAELGKPAQTRRYIDTGPVMEKLYAAAAGLGWLGKNTLILNEQEGSYFFLSVILTDLPLPADTPVTDRCGTCTRCLDACPTQAIVAPYVLDATRCISYHTIESKQPLPSGIASKLEENLFGCDICQEVCPWNREIGTHRAEFNTRASYLKTSLTNLQNMAPAAFQDIFKKSPLKRAGLAKLKGTASLISDPASTAEPVIE